MTPSPSLFQIRLRAPHTADDAQWAATLRALSENKAACDEVWFSTGIDFPPMDWHRAHAARLGKCAADLRGRGIVPSLQFQSTLGHGDSFAGTPEMTAGRTWGGFTGPSGVECKACNCPRQPELLAYVREMARLYAEAVKPAWLWIDDDLRVNNHRPAAGNEDIGCWCPTCRKAFGKILARSPQSSQSEIETSRTLRTLREAISASPALAAAWKRFSFESIAGVARAIAEETHAVSPETRFGYQHGGWPDDSQLAVFRALREAGGGRAVGSRPGGGRYFDLDPGAPVEKALHAARQKRVLGSPGWIEAWLPEIETCPRAFASRTARGIMLEAIASLAYGMNGLSALVMDTRAETDEWYSENILAPLAAERPLLERYRDANLGTEPAGIDIPAGMPLDDAWQCALSGVPVLPGPGLALAGGGLETASPFVRGHRGEADSSPPSGLGGLETASPLAQTQGGGGLQSAVFPASFRVSRCSTRDLARIRSEADAASGGRLPVVVETPTVGIVVPRVSSGGALRTVMMLNARIEPQKAALLRLRGVPAVSGAAQNNHAVSGAAQNNRAIWRAFGEPPVTLEVLREGGDALVTLPPLGAWNAGFLEFER